VWLVGWLVGHMGELWLKPDLRGLTADFSKVVAISVWELELKKNFVPEKLMF